MTLPFLLALSVGTGTNFPNAEYWFIEGVQTRHDSTRSQMAFAKAAVYFSTATPESALAKGRAHYLGGQTPQALAALHAGLALAPYHRELQLDLQAIRDTIRYPEPADPKLRVRPDPPPFHFSPRFLFGSAACFGFLAALGVGNRFTVRSQWSPIAIGVGVAGFLAMAWLANRSNPVPPTILAREAVLRKGNGESYSAKLTDPLPAGAEVRELVRRGGWVKVELPGGATGWLPESALLK